MDIAYQLDWYPLKFTFIKSCEIGQAVLYACPIQCDLDTSTEFEEPKSNTSPEER